MLNHRPIPCTLKRIYFTEKLAHAAKNRVMTDRGAWTRVYKCNFCPWWHLTSKEIRK